MVFVGQLVDNADLPQERKEPVKNSLLQLGFSASSSVDKAFCSLTEKQLTEQGLSIADSNAILAELASLSEYTLRVTGLGSRGEGVVSRVSVGYFTRRAKTCKQVVRMLQQERLVMIRGPPRSGKTSLCRLVALTAKDSSIFQQVFYFNCAAVYSDTGFQCQFQQLCGVTFDEAAQQASESNRTLFILDDAHRTYDASACLWGWAKRILDHPTTPPPIMILTASSHGSKPLASMGYTASPVEFAATRSIVFRRHDDDQPALQFTDSELTEVFDSFCLYSKRQSSDVQMLKNCIGDMSERHPGLVLHMLDVLDDNSKHAHKHSTDYVAQAQAWYLSWAFITKLEYLRSFMRSDLIMTPGAQHELLEKLLFKRQVIVRRLPEQEQAAANLLTRSGYLAIEPSEVEADQGAFVVTFTSRLHMEYTRFWFYHHSRDVLAQMPTALSDFLRLVLQRMSSTRMASCLNSSSSPSRGLVEAHYQTEFYRACVSVLPYQAYINPDVGPIYGVSGQLDFMLLPLKWGFELLTDGKATKKDLDRFLPAGKYHRLMTQGNMTEYAVLDIRSNHTQPALHDHANLYHVLFVSEFKSAELRLGSKLLATVHLDT